MITTPNPYDKKGIQYGVYMTPNTKKLYAFGESSTMELQQIFKQRPTQTKVPPNAASKKPPRPSQVGYQTMPANALSQGLLDPSEGSGQPDVKKALLNFINNSDEDDKN